LKFNALDIAWAAAKCLAVSTGRFELPRGPKGERRPADVISNAVKVMRIATGEIDEDRSRAGQAKGGKIGAKRRAKALTPQQRSEIARLAAAARWKKG
jgi:hypothetical protein